MLLSLSVPLCFLGQFNRRFHGSRHHLESRARMLGKTVASRAKLRKIRANLGHFV